MEMNVIRRLNESQLIKATDETIGDIVKEEINKLGYEADLNHIDVSDVTDMGSLFYNEPFNGDISLWNVENVRNMSNMFYKSKFNGDLDIWKPKSLKWCLYSFYDSPLHTKEPIWLQCLSLKVFKSGEDYCDSLKYNWLVGKIIFFGRLKMVVDLFDGDLSEIDKVKEEYRFKL